MGELKDWALGVAAKVSTVSVAERQAGDVVIISLTGNIITGGNANTVRDITTRLLAEGHRKILLDMAHVRWVDSMGLGTLVAAMVSVTREGGQIKLLRARENIKELLNVTKLDTVLATYESESEALNDYE